MVREPFFCTRINSVPGTGRCDYPTPRIAVISKELLKEKQEVRQQMNALIAKTKPGWLLRTARVILIAAIVLALFFLLVMYKEPGSLLLVLGIVAVCVFGICCMGRYSEKRELKAYLSPQYLEMEAQEQAVDEKIALELGIPKSCKQIDILSFCYTNENGIIKIGKNSRGLFSCTIKNISVFVRDNSFVFSTGVSLYAFDLKKLTGFRAVTEKLCIENWPDPEIGGGYEAYGSLEPNGEDEYGTCYTIAGYCVLGFEMDDVVWELYMPQYSAPTIEKLIGRKAEFYSKTQHSN